jgi:hypothetical protein
MENLLKKKSFKYENETPEKNIFSINDGNNLENDNNLNNNNNDNNKIFQRRKSRSITHSQKDNQSFRSKLYFSQENSKKNLQRFYVNNNSTNKPILLSINNSNNNIIGNNNSINNSGSNINLKTYSSDDDFKQLKIEKTSQEKIRKKKSKFYV